MGFPLLLPPGKGTWRPVTCSLAVLLDLEGILGPARIHPGHPSGLFPFASPDCASPGGRWDYGRGEEQQVVSPGVSAVHRPWGTGREGWARGSWREAVLAEDVAGEERHISLTKHLCSEQVASCSTILISSLIKYPAGPSKWVLTAMDWGLFLGALP